MSDTLTLLPPNATATERAFARVIGYESRINLGPKYRALWEPNGNPSSITINGIKFSSFHQGIDRNNYVLDIQVSESNSVEYAEKIGLGGERQKKLTIRYEIGITYSDLSIIVNNLSAIAEEIKAEFVNDGVVSIDNGLYKLSGGTGCPYDTLPWLAWSLHVDEWDTNWTEQQKRDVIAASVAVHKTKGTIGALKRALAALGYEVTVDENTGEVYTFRLEFDLNQTGILGTDTFAAARRVAMANKNARSKLLAVRSSLTANAGVYGAVAHHRAQTVTVEVSNNPTLLVAITGGWNYSEGASVTLTCVATGTGPFTYAWSFEGVPISGENGDTYSFTMGGEETAGSYSCDVTDAYGRVVEGTTEVGLAYDANTLLLVQVDATGNIVEQTGNGTVTTSGTVIVDHTTTHDGFGSIRNTAAGSTTAAGYTQVAASLALTGDFTIEGWCNRLNSSTGMTWLSSYPEIAKWQIQNWGSSTYPQVDIQGGIVGTSTIANPINTFVHFAISRSGSMIRFFVNGNIGATVTSAADLSCSGILIGDGPNGDNPISPCCWENIRISNTARYTENFTPPGRF